jgi:hypothetical protein
MMDPLLHLHVTNGHKFTGFTPPTHVNSVDVFAPGFLSLPGSLCHGEQLTTQQPKITNALPINTHVFQKRLTVEACADVSGDVSFTAQMNGSRQVQDHLMAHCEWP